MHRSVRLGPLGIRLLALGLLSLLTLIGAACASAPDEAVQARSDGAVAGSAVDVGGGLALAESSDGRLCIVYPPLPEGLNHVRQPLFISALASVESWLQVESLDESGHQYEGMSEFAVSSQPRIVGGDTDLLSETGSFVAPQWLDAVDAALHDAGATLYVGLTDSLLAGESALLYENRAGELAILTACEFSDQQNAEFDTYLSDVGLVPGNESRDALLRSLAGFPSADAELGTGLLTSIETGNQHVAWIDRPAESRSVEDDEVPEDYLASLVSIAATVHVPASWLGSSDAVLCSWSLAGWGECTSLAIAEDAEAAVPVLDLSLLVPADEDADVEFYLSVDATTRQESLVKLGSVPVAQLKASEGAVDITAAAESVDQLVEANAGSGRDMDLVSIGKNSG